MENKLSDTFWTSLIIGVFLGSFITYHLVNNHQAEKSN
jgi:hypothetical protein